MMAGKEQGASSMGKDYLSINSKPQVPAPCNYLSEKEGKI